ncbi:hypothetical protein [Pseudomonas sp. Marseille-P9899]|uniref:hypothetical protein n=1 Tax=Pseudomonas sp. Marseille-P9899 TaxID=2730401 RepID=UPI00158C4B39|nr:hypothetical protein [Pseudomonas sp. Marseille-P9899]
MDRHLARVADLLAKPPQTLTVTEQQTLARFNHDVASALPIGTSEAHRVVQEAVAEYLKERASESIERIASTKHRVKQRIIGALREIL